MSADEHGWSTEAGCQGFGPRPPRIHTFMVLPSRPVAPIRVKWRAPEKDPRGARMVPLLKEITAPVGLGKGGRPPALREELAPVIHLAAACSASGRLGHPASGSLGSASLGRQDWSWGVNIPAHTCDSHPEAGALLPVGRGTGVSWAPKRPGLGRPGCLGRAAARSFLLGVGWGPENPFSG